MSTKSSDSDSSKKCVKTWNGVSSRKCELYCDMNAGYYPVQNYLNKCSAITAAELSFCNPTVNPRDGYGWVSLNGTLIDQDSKVRNDKSQMTHGKGRHHLEDRTNQTGYKARGPLIVDTESMLKLANFNSAGKLQCSAQADVTEYNMNYLPEENNPQRVEHIIPPMIQNGGWVRGGMDTRMELRKIAHGCFYKQ
jgi:hypothetical protein